LDEQRRRFDTIKYDINRESLYEDGASQGTSTPSQIFIATETLEKLLANEPAHYQEVVRLRAQGCTQSEIAKRTGMTERTVRRVLARLYKENDASLN
ncbi:MAG: sigma factor-like helix-turn-helix DNA-binding protein, partial [Planctomycetota bacterium]